MKYVNEKLLEFNNYIKNKKVAIIGLGVSNLPLIDYLYKLGSEITLFNNFISLSIITPLKEKRIKMYLYLF